MDKDDDSVIQMILDNPDILKQKDIKRRYKEIIKQRVKYIESTVFRNFALGYISDEMLQEVNLKTYDEKDEISPLDYKPLNTNYL